MILFKNKMSAMTESFEIEHDGLAMAMFESSREFSELQGGVPVALSNVYEMFVTDTSKTEEQKTAVLEGVMSDAWEKIKNFFKKIADKIRAWFKSVIKFFQTIFLSNKKFVEKFKSEIMVKGYDKFEYKGHDWKMAELDRVGSAVEATKNFAEASFKAAENLSGIAGQSIGKVDVTADKKKIDSKIGAKSVSDMRTSLVKAVMGRDSKVIKKFSVASPSDMLKVVTDEKEAIDDIKESIDATAEAAEAYADRIDKIQSKYESVESDPQKRSNFMRSANDAAAVAKYQLSYMTAFLEEKKSLTHKRISEFSSVLRSFARYKPAKEDYIPEGASGSQSLLEAYMIDA